MNTKICNFVIEENFQLQFKKEKKNIFFTNDIKHPGFIKMNSLITFIFLVISQIQKKKFF